MCRALTDLKIILERKEDPNTKYISMYVCMKLFNNKKIMC